MQIPLFAFKGKEIEREKKQAIFTAHFHKNVLDWKSCKEFYRHNTAQCSLFSLLQFVNQHILTTTLHQKYFSSVEIS